jgi:hypothetical protein
MYVAYTTVDLHAQLSRFTVTGGGTTASLASEVVYWRGNQLQVFHHAINDVHIGPTASCGSASATTTLR